MRSFFGSRVTIIGRAAFQNIRNKHLLAVQTDGQQHRIQQLAGPPYERFAQSVFIGARRFTNDQPVGLVIANAKYGLGAGGTQPARSAFLNGHRQRFPVHAGNHHRPVVGCQDDRGPISGGVFSPWWRCVVHRSRGIVGEWILRAIFSPHPRPLSHWERGESRLQCQRVARHPQRNAQRGEVLATEIVIHTKVIAVADVPAHSAATLYSAR